MALILLIFFQFSASALSAPVTLFTEGRADPNYSRNLLALEQQGGTIRFSNGRELTLAKKLGEGGTAVIFLTTEGTAIRLAKVVGNRLMNRFLREYAEGQKPLRD